MIEISHGITNKIFFGTGSSIEHGPEYLIERDIVIVTINYRLGAFGFLALDMEEISGNAGLKVK